MSVTSYPECPECEGAFFIVNPGGSLNYNNLDYSIGGPLFRIKTVWGQGGILEDDEALNVLAGVSDARAISLNFGSPNGDGDSTALFFVDESAIGQNIPVQGHDPEKEYGVAEFIVTGKDGRQYTVIGEVQLKGPSTAFVASEQSANPYCKPFIAQGVDVDQAFAQAELRLFPYLVG